MSDLAATISRYLGQGGLVMLPLAGAAFVLYYALGYRAYLLLRGGRTGPGQVREVLSGGGRPGSILGAAAAVARSSRGRPPAARRLVLEELARHLEDPLTRGAVLARTVVVVAPLLGLLGTVSGMIEMFDSLGTGTFYAQEGGIAHGIAEALFTTQLGLAIAIPGYFATRVLDQREARLRNELEQLTGLACVGLGEHEAAA